jgi:hypothetical protein
VLDDGGEARRAGVDQAEVAAVPMTASAKPSAELAYADGEAYTMLGVYPITNASPGILDAPPLYVMGYVPPPGSTPGQPITLPSGYQPQCNQCLQEPIAYHDHLLTGAPGLGTNGTSGSDYLAPWRIVVMLYNPAWSNRPDFTPITDDGSSQPPRRRASSCRSTRGAANPYEIWTTNVLVCPVVHRNRS